MIQEVQSELINIVWDLSFLHFLCGNGHKPDSTNMLFMLHNILQVMQLFFLRRVADGQNTVEQHNMTTEMFATLMVISKGGGTLLNFNCSWI